MPPFLIGAPVPVPLFRRRPQMNDFLNPKSMLTPGASGALVMVLANSLCLAFPEMAFRYIAIGLSFVLGLLVFQAVQMAVGQRVIYWILNSLIIFTMGVGATTIGAKLEGFQEAPLPAARASATAALSLVWMLSDAQAQ